VASNPLAGIVMATLLEAEPLLQIFDLQQVEERPFPLYIGGDVVLVISGIGKANAAMATVYCAQKYSPIWLCNIGAAGATDSACPLGSIYHIGRVIEFDRPYLRLDAPRIHAPHVLQGFPMATVATQDKPVIDAGERQKVSLQAELVDMEAAAVVQACRKFEVRCVIFKFVSDTPDHPGSDDIAENIEQYRATFCRFFSSSVMPVLRAASEA